MGGEGREGRSVLPCCKLRWALERSVLREKGQWRVYMYGVFLVACVCAEVHHLWVSALGVRFGCSL
jgi:hypothetical protein